MMANKDLFKRSILSKNYNNIMKKMCLSRHSKGGALEKCSKIIQVQTTAPSHFLRLLTTSL